MSEEPSVADGEWNGGEHIGGIVIAGIDASQGGEGNENPRPAQGGPPDESGAHGGGDGICHMGGGEGATADDITFWDA